LLDNGSLGGVVSEGDNFNDIAPANALGEQVAAANYFTANHPTAVTAYNTPEVPQALDERIQFIGVRTDTVLEGAPINNTDWLLANGYTSTGPDTDGNGVPDDIEYFFDQSPNDPTDLGNLPRTANATDLTGKLRYSTDLAQWFDAVLGVDYEIISEILEGDVIVVRYRLLKGA
jgi:hypothetical protein